MAATRLTMPVVSVIAAKGSVGKTTVAANLCIALAESGGSMVRPMSGRPSPVPLPPGPETSQ